MSTPRTYRRQARVVMPSRFPLRHDPMAEINERLDRMEAEVRRYRRGVEAQYEYIRNTEAALRMVVAALGALPGPGDC